MKLPTSKRAKNIQFINHLIIIIIIIINNNNKY